MRKQEFYRNEYCIGVYMSYTNNNMCLGICDNIKEFAEFMEIKPSDASMILSKAFRNQIEFIRFNGYKCKIEFINKSYVI